MKGAQDLGGRHGFGPVVPEADEPPFHAEWEKRALALVVAMGATGSWPLDTSRHARESLPPADYLASSYYEIWLAGLEKLLTEHGLATADEIESGAVSVAAKPVARVLAGENTANALASSGSYDRPTDAKPRFSVSDSVQTRLTNPPTHTRLPSYAMGRTGSIHAVHGFHVFPDANAHGGGEDPQWLYSVRFAAEDLWGAETTAADVFIDLWEPYLEPA